MQRVRSVFVVILLLVGGMGCTSVNSQYVPIISVEIDPRYAAITVCDLTGQPVVIMNDDYKVHPGQRFTLAHELVHVRQMKAAKNGCLGYLADYGSDPRFKMRSEAEAMCAELHLGMSEGLDATLAYSQLLANLEQQFPSIPAADRLASVPCRAPVKSDHPP
jgi:hypothetical protein